MDFSMNFKETVLTILKDSMVYKTRQSLFIPRHSRTFKEHINPEYRVLILLNLQKFSLV